MDDLNKIQGLSRSTGQRAITIGGSTYTIQLLPALKGLTIGKKLINVVLPVITSFFEGEKRKEELLVEEQTMFTELTLLLVNQLEGFDEQYVVEQLLSPLYKDGTEVNPDVIFSGDYSTLITLIEFAIKENFGDFFTKYLKEKGFDLPSLREMIQTDQPEEEPSKSNEK